MPMRPSLAALLSVALSRTFRAISLDRLGQGGTDHLPADDYPDYYALDPVHLRNFIEALGLDDVTLVGHSQGSWPADAPGLRRGRQPASVKASTVRPAVAPPAA